MVEEDLQPMFSSGDHFARDIPLPVRTLPCERTMHACMGSAIFVMATMWIGMHHRCVPLWPSTTLGRWVCAACKAEEEGCESNSPSPTHSSSPNLSPTSYDNDEQRFGPPAPARPFAFR
eukprot:7385402-Prymnesium_polylepis.1